jgi:hypothetical protein
MNHSKIMGSEQRGILLHLLCSSHTKIIKIKLTKNLRGFLISTNNFFKILKLYLSMEEWFHQQSNLKEEELAPCPLVAIAIELMKSVFPRMFGQG